MIVYQVDPSPDRLQRSDPPLSWAGIVGAVPLDRSHPIDGHSARFDSPCWGEEATLRPSARADVSVHHRDVGALLLLRHALAARALHDQISAARRPLRQRDWARRAQARARRRVRPARRAAALLADL